MFFYLNICIYSAFNILFGLSSLFIKERLFISESLVSLLFGVIFGSSGLNLIFPDEKEIGRKEFWEWFYQLARLVMTFQTMAAGISLPRAYLRKKWKSLAILLGPVMLSMWLTSTFVIYTLFNSHFSVLEAMTLAACITPTDPVLASSIVKGRFAEEHIPEHVRDLLSAESGANDGAAMPLLFLPLILIKSGPSALLSQWFFSILLGKVLLSIFFGVVFGLAANRMLKYSQYHDLIDKQSFIAFSLALSLLIMSLMNLIGCNDMLAVFVAGAVFAWDDWFTDQTKESQLQPVVDSIFNSTFFVMFGAALPWKSFVSLGTGKLVLTSATILLFRRMPAVWFFGPLKIKRERAFAGWFGPIGVGAIFYSIFTTRALEYQSDRFIPLTCFIVMSSVLAHGITVPLFHMTMTRQLTLDMIRMDYWKTIDYDISDIEIEREEIVADLMGPSLAHDMLSH